MKKLVIILIMVPFIVKGQADINYDKNKITINPETGLVAYTFIDSLSASKEKLYSRGMEWIAINFKDANYVVKLQDKDAGKIIAKGNSRLSYLPRGYHNDIPSTYTQFFTLDLSFKDNKYRAIITDFVVKSDPLYLVGSIESPIEKYLSLIPSKYDFEKLKAYEKRDIILRKQLLNNSTKLSNGLFNSIKEFMKKAGSTNNW